MLRRCFTLRWSKWTDNQPLTYLSTILEQDETKKMGSFQQEWDPPFVNGRMMKASFHMLRKWLSTRLLSKIIEKGRKTSWPVLNKKRFRKPSWTGSTLTSRLPMRYSGKEEVKESIAKEEQVKTGIILEEMWCRLHSLEVRKSYTLRKGN